jgi:DNA-binding HxlR family transcriptional regulator
MVAVSDTTTSTPLDLSGFREAPPAAVAPLVEKVAREPEDKALTALTALMMNRALRLLRQGSRQEILDESLMLNRVLAIEAGAHLRQSRPEVFGGWSALGELLSGAARSTSRAAIPAILSGSRGREILELLAGEGRPVARSEIKRQLEFTSESHLSHLLRDLEEAELVLRYKHEGGKEVLVELGPVGHQVVDQSVLPRWLKLFEEVLQEISGDPPFEAEKTLAARLVEAGAPSHLAANRLVRAVTSFATTESAAIPAQVRAMPALQQPSTAVLARKLSTPGELNVLQRETRRVGIDPGNSAETEWEAIFPEDPPGAPLHDQPWPSAFTLPAPGISRIKDSYSAGTGLVPTLGKARSRRTTT